MPSRRFKFYMKVDSGRAPIIFTGAPPENSNSSSAKKTNVGAVVGFTFLLVFILVIVFICIYRNRRSPSSPRTPTQRPVVAQPVQVQELVQRPAGPGLARKLGKEEVVGEVINSKGQEVVGKEDDAKVVRPKRHDVGQGQGNEERRDEKKKKVVRPKGPNVGQGQGQGQGQGNEELRDRKKREVARPKGPNLGQGQGQGNEEGIDEMKKEVARPKGPNMGQGQGNKERKDEKKEVGKPKGPNLGQGQGNEERRDEKKEVAQPKRPNVGQGNEERRDGKEVVGEVIKPRRKKGQRQGKREGREKIKRVEVEEVVGKVEDDDGIGMSNKKRRDRKQHLQGEDHVGREHKRGKEDVEEVPKKIRELGKKPQEVVLEQQNSLGLPKKYTYEYLKSVTNDFDIKNRIGGGGFGTVYKGILTDGTFVAVKCMRFEGRIDDFKNEVDALGKADHCNLVKLIGYCNEGITRILVYEYMENGSLDTWIFPSKRSRCLMWPEMRHIIRGIAEGVEYLHEKFDKKILHRDLKPPNVILDGSMNAKLCDFGIAKLLNKDQSSTSTAWAGTEGYMAPEVKKGRISDKIDVYSFGVVVLEVVFGKRYHKLISLDQNNSTEVINLPDLIKNLGEDMKKNSTEIEMFGRLAMFCLREKPEKRPTMSDVVTVIHSLEARFNGAKARRK
ncbi:hypothetical protein RND81_02G100400 [Saponaria officinalis]